MHWRLLAGRYVYILYHIHFCMASSGCRPSSAHPVWHSDGAFALQGGLHRILSLPRTHTLARIHRCMYENACISACLNTIAIAVEPKLTQSVHGWSRFSEIYEQSLAITNDIDTCGLALNLIFSLLRVYLIISLWKVDGLFEEKKNVIQHFLLHTQIGEKSQLK